MASKYHAPSNRTRRPISILIVIGLCCFFYLIGVWQKSGSGKGDKLALAVTEQTADCNIFPPSTLDFESHHNYVEMIESSEPKTKVFKSCEAKYTDYTPCQEQDRAMTFPRENMIYRERHCPPDDEKLRCLILAPKGYTTPFPWPKSRDYAYYANVPYKHLTVEKAVQNWVQFQGNVFKFPGGGTMFPKGADAYIDELASVVPIKSGMIRTALDTGCGVASWGAYLLKRNILAMSFAPKDNHEAQVQFALERGVPAVIGVFGSIHLPYPSRAFDMSHCSRCLIPWASNEGMYMMEVDRVLRPGGYWILSGPPLNWKTYHRVWNRTIADVKAEQKRIEDFAELLCWEKKYENKNSNKMAEDEAESTLELPECPVCLQQYGDVSTVPRVIACGHSACEDCLTQLQNPFPCTIRCPSCTQLVKLPNPISCLPKNIDLLRFSTPNTSKTPNNHVSTEKYDKDPIFIKPHLWSHEFYSTWRTWVLPEDSIIIESNGSDDDNNGFCFVCYGKVLKVLKNISCMGCVLKENEKVSLLEIGYFDDLNKGSCKKFEYSYEVKVMSVLYGLSEGERNELESIIKSSLGLHVMCKVYGFWYNMDNHCVYMVSETFSGSLLRKVSVLKNAILEKNGDDKVSNAGLVIVGSDVCQAVNNLHLGGLLPGYLGLSCFGFDEFGHVYVDISEVLATGRRVHKTLIEIIVGTVSEDLMVKLINKIVEDCVFVSPELLFELLKLDDTVINLGSSKHHVGYGSDIWSLACVIISFLVDKPFAEEMQNYLSYLVTAVRDEKGVDYVRWYMEWRQKIMILIECRMGSEFINVKEILFTCLDYNPANRPVASELWKTLRVLVIKSELDEVIDLKQEMEKENMCNCLILGDLCQSADKIRNQSSRCTSDTCVVENANQEEADGVEKLGADKDVVEGLSGGQVKCIDLKGHLNCITGLVIGGGFLFSSSFDKMVNVWSLQDYSHVHSFKGHEQRVMAVAFVDYEEPLCISGDNGGAICIWRASTPLTAEPLKKLQEQQDWRYSGIHALAVSGSQYLYTGSGDKSIKAWSLQDYSLSCTMNGHKSVVSSLAICDEVLYSGSWDGTVRLWCLSDHCPLAVLGEEAPGNVCSVFCLAVDENVLVAAHENGLTKIWFDDILVKSAQEHDGAIFSACKKGKWLFTGGWDKMIKVKELYRDGDLSSAIPLGSITCDSVVTALFYWQGKLFGGQADGVIKVYYSAVR